MSKINERSKLWKMIKEKFKGKNEDFKTRDYKYSSIEKMIIYLQDIQNNPPKENYLTTLKNDAKILNKELKGTKIKLNLSKIKLQEELKNIWNNRTQEVFNIFGKNENHEIKNDFIDIILNSLKKLALSPDDRYILEITTTDGIDKNITLTPKNIDRWKDIIQSRIRIIEENKPGSDSLKEIEGHKIKTLFLRKIENGFNNRKYNGFFKYVNNSDIDLSRYGIYTLQQLNESNNEVFKSCLIRTLENCNIDRSLISNVVASFPTEEENNFPMCKMRTVCEMINKNIIMHYLYTKYDRIDMIKFIINENYETIEISQYKNHIFNYDKTIYSSIYIKNKKLIDEQYPNNINRFKFNKTKKETFYLDKTRESYITSLNLVIMLNEGGFFTEYEPNLIENKIINNFYKIEPVIDNVEKSQNPYRNKETKPEETKEEVKPEEAKEEVVIYADIETQVNEETQYHHILAFCFKFKGINYVFKNTGDVNEMIKEIKECLLNLFIKDGICYRDYRLNKFIQKKNVKMMFHNAKYDSKILEKYFYSSSEVMKDNQFYSKDYSLIFGVKFKVVDFYKHFNRRLEQATETFKIEAKKCPGINYLYYSPEKMNDHLVDVEEYKQGVKPKDQEAFINVIRTMGEEFNYIVIDDGLMGVKPIEKFNPVKFYLYYLEQDVNLLCDASNKYNEIMKELINIDPSKYLTISSVANTYCKNQGAFDELYEVSGGLRDYIQKSVRGGRVYVNPNYQMTVINDEISDFDGVSLYPSAISRLCKEYGLPVGEIKSSNNSDINFYLGKSWFVCKILLKKINKTQMIPMINIKEDTDQSSNYTNEVLNPVIQYVDKITLEDWITYHEIDYEIINGVYWENGFNKKLGEVIEKLHIDRCHFKKIKNTPMQEMLKLVSNSIYGKTGTKKSTTQTRFIPNNKVDKFIYENYGLIKDIEKTEFNNKITISAFDKSSSLNYVASAILSMSKRIMQEIFSIANDFNYPIFYTDTDSIHLLKKHIEPLSEKFNIKYGREIVGKDLGQFHNDFSIDGCINVMSKKLIPLGPKSYLDVIEGVDELTGKIVRDVHIRLKGITGDGIEDKLQYIAKLNNKKFKNLDSKNRRIESAIILFESLALGKKFRFYLNPTVHSPSFEYTKNGIMSRQVGKFSRDVCFIKNKKLRKVEGLEDEIISP